MSALQHLITEHIAIWTAAETEKKSGRGRASSNAGSVYGIKKLRELILELAVRGKLVQQDADDEPASELLKQIQAEKAKLVVEGKLKKDKPLGALKEEEKPFELPNGWIFSRLNDVFDVRDGTHDSPKFLDVGYPFVTSKNLYTGKLDFGDVKYVSEEDHRKFSIRSNVQRGDILFAMIGSIGNPAIVETDLEFSIKNVALIKPYKHKLSNAHHLLLNLKASTEKMKSEAGGGVQSFISLGNLRKHPIAIPPLEEQHRIVAKVDELMALCDQLEAQHSNAADAHEQLVSHLLGTLTQSQDAADFNTNWQRIATHFDTLFTTESSIDTLKQTLLQLAVMGKLVPQDPNDEPASELLKRIQVEKARLVAEGKMKKDKPLAEVGEDENPYSIPKHWKWVALDNISQVGTGATPLRTTYEYFNPPSISWVTSGETSNSFIFETEQYVSPLALKETNLTVYPKGTLIVAMYGQGKTRGQITELMIDACTNQACAAIRLISDNESHRKYVKLFFEKIYDEIRELAAGGAQPNLNLSKVKETLLPLPPLAEQHRIVAKVNELMILCEQLKSRITDGRLSQQKLADVLVANAVK